MKLIKKIDELELEAKRCLEKFLLLIRRAQKEKKVKRIYIEEAYDIEQELYLSCLVDRESSKIAFISSTEGGVDIESVAKKNPEKKF